MNNGAEKSEESPAEEYEMSSDWEQFFNIVPLHKEAQKLMLALVGDWPEGLNPDVFSLLDLHDFFKRVQEYRTMPYPIRPFCSIVQYPKPRYKMVDGKINRESSPSADIALVHVVPSDMKFEEWMKEPGYVVWKLVMHYSQLPLAKLVFLMPEIYRSSEASKNNETSIIVTEYAQMQIYRGVENLLFDVYSDLPEGGLLTETAVNAKLKSILSVQNNSEAHYNMRSEKLKELYDLAKDMTTNARYELVFKQRTQGKGTSDENTEYIDAIFGVIPELIQKTGASIVEAIDAVLATNTNFDIPGHREFLLDFYRKQGFNVPSNPEKTIFEV
jgi:hypothetical protein